LISSRRLCCCIFPPGHDDAIVTTAYCAGEATRDEYNLPSPSSSSIALKGKRGTREATPRSNSYVAAGDLK
jgi:hypothetical protein